MKRLISIVFQNRHYLYSFLFAMFFVWLFTFFAYHNFNWFPEKERNLFTLKVYYQSGRVDIKTFELPKTTHFSIVRNSGRGDLTSIWYYNDKPFGKEYGYLVMGAEDYEVINIK